MVKKDWIQKVEKSIDKKGTEDVFSDKAKRAKMTTSAFAAKIIKEYKAKKTHTKPETKTYRQAVLARTFSKMSKKK
mgnify:CR=1 FL=1